MIHSTQRRHSRPRPSLGGFSLPELLVVIAILAVLVALLLPAILSAKRRAAAVKCQSNLRVLGQALYTYAAENDGWIYPLTTNPKTGGISLHFGLPVPPHERWPAIVFKMPAASAPLPYDPASYTSDPYDPVAFSAEPFTPPVLLCPIDLQAYEAHTYVLNGHLGRHGFRLGSRDLGGRTTDRIILAGEKRSQERDYYLQALDYDRLIDLTRHGERNGSNLLFLDGHADLHPPTADTGVIDPWDVQK